MNLSVKNIFGLFVVALLTACETLSPVFESPDVELQNVRVGEQRGLTQYFDVELAIENRNSYPLNIVGINYRLRLEGFDVIEGSTGQLPGIQANASDVMTVELGIGMLEGLQFLSSIAGRASKDISYDIFLEIDTGIPLIGLVPVTKQGVFDAGALTQR